MKDERSIIKAFVSDRKVVDNKGMTAEKLVRADRNKMDPARLTRVLVVHGD